MVKITLIYAGHQIDYLYGLLSGFQNNPNLSVNIVDTERFDEKIVSTSNNVKFLNYLDKKGKTIISEIFRWIKYYIKLTIYLFKSDTEVIHIEWINRKIDFFEHIYFILIKFLTKKKIVFKVHDLDTNVLLKGGAKKHDTLKFSNLFFLKNCDGIITHNNYVKSILIKNGISETKIRVIPHGINNYQILDNISKNNARQILGIDQEKKVLLFFGNIRSYKCLDLLLQMCANLKERHSQVHLIIAGKNDITDNGLNRKIKLLIKHLEKTKSITYLPGFVKNSDTSLFFKASDALVLPYKFIYQSGLPFLSFAAGLPVISSNVGGLPEDIDQYINGYVTKLDSLEEVLEQFITGDLKFNSPQEIIECANKTFNWKLIINQNLKLYEEIRKRKL